MEEINDIAHMTLDGGESCFDFINSGYNDKEEVITERLHTYDDLLILAARVAILTDNRMEQLRTLANANPTKAANSLELAKKVRGLMYHVFKAIAKKQMASIETQKLEDFNSHLFTAQSMQTLVIEDDRLVPAIQTKPNDLNEPLYAFLQSAYHVLRDKDQHRIRQCGACQWLFFDNTKNNKRKWCDMQSCGSLEKSKRYYKRKKEANSDK